MTTAAKNYGPIQSFKAGAAITANRAVKMSADNTVIHTTAITEDVVGISLSTVASGEYVDVQTAGKAKVGGSAVALTYGQQVMPYAEDGGLCAVAAGATAKSFGIVTIGNGGTKGELAEILLRLGVNGPANS